MVRKASLCLSICIMKDWKQKRPGSKTTLPQKSVSMNIFSSAVLTGCCFVSILQKAPKDVADDSGAAVSIVSRFTVDIATAELEFELAKCLVFQIMTFAEM